jgi:hypothetical protein
MGNDVTEFDPRSRDIGRLNATAVDRLARHLHFTMERLDPSEDHEWNRLTESQRDFYRECVREVFWKISSEPVLVRVLNPG